jgi:hypothetical protein
MLYCQDTSSDSHFGKPTQLNGNNCRWVISITFLRPLVFVVNVVFQSFSVFSWSILMILNPSLFVRRDR